MKSFIRTRTIILGLITMASISGPGLAAEPSSIRPDRPKVALVLSGGGAKGLAHIGVLNVMKELHVPVDCVIGTSMGALVGGIYAAGVEPATMQQVIAGTDIAELFNDNPPRADIAYQIKKDDSRPLFDMGMGLNDFELELPYGASDGYRFELFLKQFIGLGASSSNLDFDELPTPYRGTATDLETGDLKVFDQGDLARVMRASMSLPAVVAPTVIDDHIYVDGGLIRNLPIDIGRQTCGEVIIAVNLGTTPKSRNEIRNIIDVASQAVILLTEQNVNASLKELNDEDILITPDLAEFGTLSFENGLEIIERGEQAAWANKEALSQLSVPAEEYEQWLYARNSRIPETPAVTSIAVTTDGAVNSEAVKKDITVEAGENFNISQLNNDLLDIYGRGDFSYVGYSIVPDEDTATVIIDARSRPWGPGYLEFGLGAAADLESPTQLNLAASYRRTWINSLGAEWRTDAQLGYDSFLVTEFMQPLQVRDGAFVTPYIGAGRRPVQIYEKDIRLGAVDTRNLQGGFNIGVTGKHGELKLGPYAGRVITKNDFGVVTPILPEQDVHQVGLLLRGVYDQLDSLTFPRSGVSAVLDIRATREAWGSEDQFTRANFKLLGVKSFGKHTISGQLEWGDELSGKNKLPIYEAFKLGGPRRLSGLYLDQLTGSRYNLATFSYYRQYASLPSQIGRGLYIGGSLEAGRIDDQLMKNPNDWVQAAGIYFGADTILGTAFLGYGYSSLQKGTLYIVIGPQF